MKLLHSKLKKGEVTVLVQSLDDLWYLSTIVVPGDFVQGKTLRKMKHPAGEEKSKGAVKKPVFIKIEVEKVEFSKYTHLLRVSGVVRGAPEEIPLGDHHTFNVGENTQITIIKGEWLKHHLDKLKEACSEVMSSLLMCVHDREEAYFALFKKYGYEVLAHIRGDVQKKMGDAVKKEDFYQNVIRKISEYVERYKIRQVIIASPAFWKEDLMKEVKDKELKQKIVLATCSSVTKNGIEEVIKRPETREALKLERAAKEINKVEELFAEIARKNLAVYGLKETKTASSLGAVKDLLVTDSLIQKSIEGGFFHDVEDVMKKADKAKCDVWIISSEHEGGKRLDGLGGIAAILRFRLNY